MKTRCKITGFFVDKWVSEVYYVVVYDLYT